VDEEPVVSVFAMAWAKDVTTATFWHAKGFRRVAATDCYCKAGGQHPSTSPTAAHDFDHPFMCLTVEEDKFKALPVYEDLRQDLPRQVFATLGGFIDKGPTKDEQEAKDMRVLSLLQQYDKPDTLWEEVTDLRRTRLST
jgi:hypothetical protein